MPPAPRKASRPRAPEPIGTPAPTPRLHRDFFATDARSLARNLLGRTLVRTLLIEGTLLRLSGTVVETEAYLGVEDQAAHTFAGRRTPRNEAMYARPGTLYVYFTYGMHHCTNVVCGEEGEPTAVLLRALCPHEGIDTMTRLRTRPRSAAPSPAAPRSAAPRSAAPSPAPPRLQDLCRGPGRLCQALNITRSDNFADLVQSASPPPASPLPSVWLEEGHALDDRHVVNTPRIGVAYAGTWARRKLRWAAKHSVWVSGSG